MADRTLGRPQRPANEPPKPATEPPKPESEEEEENGKSENGAIDYPAEVTRLNGELAKRDAVDKKRNTAIRTLAAAVLTPAEEPEQVAARKKVIREQLLAIVGEIAPE